MYPFLEKGEKISYEKFNQSFQKQLRKYGNVHCFNFVFPTWVTESSVFSLISHCIIITTKLDVSVALYASKTFPVSQWSEAKMRLKKGGEFPLQKNLSIWECLQISLWKELLSLGYYYHYHCYCYYSHMVIITIINIIIVLLSLSLSALSLFLFSPGYYSPHLSIQLCGCQPPKRKWKYEENEEKKPLKKRECTSVMTVNSKNLGKL